MAFIGSREVAVNGTASADIIDTRGTKMGLGGSTITGAAGSDVYYIDHTYAGLPVDPNDRPADTIIESVGGGTDLINLLLHRYQDSGVFYGSDTAYTLVPNVENLNVRVKANEGDNSLYTFVLNGNTSANIITATAVRGNISFDINGGTGNDRLIGSTGNDILRGGAGTNTLTGGAGNDTYYIDGADSIVELLDGGTDSLISTITRTLAKNVENLTLAGSANVSGTGNTLDNIMNGNSGNNTLSGLSGADSLYGLDGNDTLLGGDGSDYLDGGSGNNRLDGGSGDDILRGGTGNDSLIGGAGEDKLEGVAGIDTLTGGAGNDTLIAGDGGGRLDGGAGNDEYRISASSFHLTTFVDSSGRDQIFVNATNESFVTTLNSTIESISFNASGSATANITGNTLSNLIAGSNNNDTLIGGSGDDTLDGGLSGVSGTDSLVGGAGSDTYNIDDTDTVVELANQGIDTVMYYSATSINLDLGDSQFIHIENGVLLGSNNLSLYGNSLDNVLNGNAGENALLGLEGDDTLDGGTDSAADTLEGGAGDDTYFIYDDLDTLIEALDGGTDTIISSAVSLTMADNIENYTMEGDGDISVVGNSLNNVFRGNLGSNTFIGGGGLDTFIGGAGDDNYLINANDFNSVITESANQGTDSIVLDGVAIVNSTFSIATKAKANIENLSLSAVINQVNLVGNSLSNQLTGNASNNSISGGNGNDTIIGSGGDDTLIGGLGNDVYYVDSSTDRVTESNVSGSGLDTIVFTYVGSHLLTNYLNVENAALASSADASSLTGSAGANKLIGNEFAQTIIGGAGNDTLDGGFGADTLIGGAGNDVYYIDEVGDVIQDFAVGVSGNINNGTDTVRTNLMTTNMGDYEFIENLVMEVDARDANGNSLKNVITGNAENNRLDGGLGADTLIGSVGDDIYIYDSLDTIIELSSEGADIVISNRTTSSIASYFNVDHLVLEVTDPANLPNNVAKGTGNIGANIIVGHLNDLDDANSLNDFRNSLSGGAANDTLVGGRLIDTLVGGANNDYYIASTDDLITEALNGGTDTVYFSKYISGAATRVTTTLGANIENATVSGVLITDPVPGSLLNDYFSEDDLEAYITGNSLNNFLTGGSFNDSLTGGLGNDTLKGAAGDDTLVGGKGNDIYYFNAGDTITELLNEGTDTVFYDATTNISLSSTVTGAFAGTAYNVIGVHLEHVTLEDTAGNAWVFGNSAANILIGNTGNNYLYGDLGNDTLRGGEGDDGLYGGVGADSMMGGDGNDFYVVDNVRDRVVEFVNEGDHDNISSYISFNLTSTPFVEDLFLYGFSTTGALLNINGTGNLLDNIIEGGEGNNSLSGGAGNDILAGFNGTDTLTGGAGNDIFRLNSVGAEKITDFTLGQDIIELNINGTSYYDQFDVPQYGDFENLTFTGIDNSLSASLFGIGGLVGGNANNYIQYDIATGSLYYDADADGIGSATLIAQLKAGTALYATDIFSHDVVI